MNKEGWKEDSTGRCGPASSKTYGGGVIDDQIFYFLYVLQDIVVQDLFRPGDSWNDWRY